MSDADVLKESRKYTRRSFAVAAAAATAGWGFHEWLDGGWAVLDPGSANGTIVNGAEIPTGVQVPLNDGDRINLGGWTAITVHRG